MAVNSIKIEIKPFKETMKETIESFKKAEKGEDVKLVKVAFNDLDTLRSVLTKERIRLLHYIRTENPESIYELAKKVDRNWGLVAKDIGLLNNAGLVILKKQTKPKEAIKPIVRFNKMNINVAI